MGTSASEVAGKPAPEAVRALDAVDELVAVLDGNRRVVYANKAFLSFTDRKSTDLAGLRPGDIFRCIHAARSPGGCGEVEDCGLCGAARAIEETERTGAPSSLECSIRSQREEDHGALEFQVNAMPFSVEGASYIMVSFRDIAARKRRAALERIFFHDVLNTASSIRVYLDLLSADPQGERRGALLERLRMISDALVEEIESQKTIVSAENGTLSVRRNLIGSRGLVDGVIQQFTAQDTAKGRTIVTAPLCEDFSLIGDDALLRRVLSNMLKNALEATPEGGTVSVGCAREGERAVFRVHNQGAMSRTVSNRVFQRYFSTKGPERGLGTYGMKLLTEQYLHGSVSFESAPRTGTEFTVSVPLRPPD